MTCSWTGVDAATTQADASSAQGETGSPAAPAPEPAVEGYESAGSSGSAVFVVLAFDPLETIRLEALRQQKLLGAFVDEAGGSHGRCPKLPRMGPPGRASSK